MSIMTQPRPAIRTGWLRIAAALAVASMTMGAKAPAAKAPVPMQNWGARIAVTPAGTHVIGNPAAKIQLVEYMSYTCSHCAEFETEAMPTLRLAFVASGKGSLEIRHFLLNPIDLTIAMLISCAPPARFLQLHRHFLTSQRDWLTNAQKATPAQQARWNAGSQASRLRAIAGDLRFYELMERNRLDRPAADRCLANEALARKLAAQAADGRKLGIEGTPSFLLDGTLLAGTHNWATLKPQLDAKF